MSDSQKTSLSYRDSGVDIDKGNQFVKDIGALVARTKRKEQLGGIGGFGALFEVPLDRYHKPVLVSGTDGVGTKLKLAMQMNKHDTIGIDLVAMCVNDIVVSGAEPLYFLDYYATGKLDLEQAKAVVKGISEGCLQAGCALAGGETAEMPGMYSEGDYDLAGFAVGVVEKEKIKSADDVAIGDVLIGIASSGPHSNGYSLIRKVIEQGQHDLGQVFDGQTLGEALLAPTTIYVPLILSLMRQVDIKSMSHITGGGIVENLPRVLPEHCVAQIRRNSWDMPEVFTWLQAQGGITESEMLRTFNCGLGMVICVPEDHTEQALALIHEYGESAWQIGQIKSGQGQPEVIWS